MALKARISKDEHAKLSEALRSEYKADGDRFVLDVESDGDFALHSSAKLASALESERKSNGELRAQVRAFEGLNADEAREALKNRDLYRTGADERTKKLEEKFNLDLKASKDAHETDRAKFREFVKTTGVKAAIADAKGKEKSLLPHVLPHVGVVEKNGEFRLVVVDDKGNPRTTKTPGSGDDMSVSEYLAGMRADDEFKALFLSDAKPGNGTPPGGGGGVGGSNAGVVSRSDPLAITAAAEDLASGKAKLG